jgi:hypothetical protein
MRKERVYIVLSHKNSLKKGSRTDWEVAETVEFVNQLRDRHMTMASAIGDYLNCKMLAGSRFGMDDYDKFDTYIRSKYSKQMEQLDAAYKSEVKEVVVEQSDQDLVVDEFGNVRTRTVFDAPAAG